MSAENIDPYLHETVLPDKLCKQDMLIEYIDPDTPEPTIPKDLPENLNDEDYLYFKEMIETQGFAVEHFPHDDDYMGDLQPLTVFNKATYDTARFAVSKFNDLKGTTLKLVNVVRGNVRPLFFFDILYFLTLECSDGCFYEAKVEEDGGSPNLKIFRAAKFYRREDKETDGEGSVERKRENIETGGEGSDECKRLKISV